MKVKIISAIPIIFSTFAAVLALGAPGEGPPPDAPQVPLSIHAPWPAGLEWMAAGKLGGYYFDEGTHKRADLYALDFNAYDDEGRTESGVLVLSVADGKVVEATCSDTGYGCSVVIGHAVLNGGCYESRYAHLEPDLLVSTGQWVAQGEPLGRAGSTGSGGGHLHFAIYRRSSDECRSSAGGANREDMAVVPESLDGVSPILDGTEITSSNYPVGYPALTEDQIFSSVAPLPERHQAIFDTYKRLGGQYFLFGLTEGPVEQLEGTRIYYQEFGPHTGIVDDAPWHNLSASIVEYEGSAYFLIEPVWQAYRRGPDTVPQFGVPASHSYEWYRQSPEGFGEYVGYRADFSKASIIWHGGALSDVEILDDQNASWDASLWPRPNSFSGVPHKRRDRYLDFYWPDARQPGPFLTEEGFSGRWETSTGGLVSAYKLQVEVRGHLEILVDGKTVMKQDSPDSVWSGSSIELGIGPEQIEVRYWQSGWRSGKLRVGISGLIAPPAFASEGEVRSSLPVPEQVEYAAFPPPSREEGLAPEPDPVDALLIDSSEHLLAKPGESDSVIFDVQNTGSMTWSPGQGFRLENINGVTLGATSPQVLVGEVPPGQVARWLLSITAPQEQGVYRTEWQMMYNGYSFGPVMSSMVIVVPEGEIGVDPGGLLEEWLNELIEQISTELNELIEQISTELNELWEDLEEQFREWLQRELERVWREFWENLLRQWCGANALVPAGLLLGMWGIKHRRRRRLEDGDKH